MKRIGQIIISLILSVCIAMSNIVLVSAASIGQVKSLKAKTVTYNSVTLSWKKVKGVTGYEVQQYSKKKWKTLKKDNKKTTYTVKKLKTGTKYKFRVRAYKKSGKKNTYGKYSKTLSVTAVPSKVNAKVSSVTVNSAKLSWSKVSGASGYYVQKKDGKKWKTVATLKSKSKSYTVKKLSLGKTYSYRVMAYRTVGKKKVNGIASSALTVKPAVPQPKNVEISDVNVDSAVISWSKASGAEGYQVQKKDDGEWETVANIKDKTDVTVTIVPGEEAEFRVRAYKGKYYSAASSTVKALYSINAAEELDVASVDEDSALLTWMAADDASGYEVQIEEDGEWITIATVTDTNYELSCEPGKKYEIRVVSFITADGKDYFASPSNTVEVEIEKKAEEPSTTEAPAATRPTTTKPTTTKPTTTKPEPTTVPVTTAPTTEPTTVPTATVPATTEPVTEPTTKAPATTQAPATQTPTTTKAPATTQAPTTTKVPATTQAPTTTKAPTTTQAPATTQKPAAAPTVNAAKYLKASVNGRKIKLSWTAPSGGATGYDVQRLSDGTWTTIATITGTSATVEAEPGVAFDYRVVSFKTVDGQNYYGSASNTKSATYTVDEPSSLSVSSVSRDGAKLTWKAASDVDGYVVQRSTNNSTWENVLTTAGTSAIVSLTPGVKTYFRVAAYVVYNSNNYYGSATSSKYTTYTVHYASSLKVTANKTSASVSWTAAKNVDGYEVQELSGSTWTTVATTSATSAEVFAIPGVKHSYRVLSYVDIAGKRYYGSATSTKYDTYKIDNPTSLKLNGTTKDAALLSWKAADGIDGYEIQKQEGSSWVKLATSATNSGEAPIVPDTDCNLRVVAYITAGGVNYYSGATNTVKARYSLAAASGLSAASVSKDSAELTWTAAKDAYAYEVQMLEGSAWKTVETVDTTSTSVSIVPSVTYKYRVVPVIDSNGTDYKGGASNEISVTYTVPGVFALKTTASDDTSVTLSWTAAEGADGYVVYNGSEVAAEVTDTTVTITGLTKATAYSFTVKSIQTVNGQDYYSPASNVATGKTTPDKVTGLICAKAGQSTVALTWDKEAVADGYTVYKKNSSGEWDTVGDTSSSSYTVTGLLSETEYEFRVSAFHKANGTPVYGEASDSVSATTTFNTVEGLTIENMNSNIVRIDWLKVEGAYYEPYYKKNASSDFERVNEGSPFRDYYHLIINEETDIGFRVTDTTNCKVSVSWNPVEGASKYEVQSRPDSSLGNWTTVASSTGTSASFIVAPETEYELRLIAFDGAFKVRAGKDYVNAPSKYTDYEVLNNIPGTISEKIEGLRVDTPAFNPGDKTVKTAYVLKAVQAINNTKAETDIKNVSKTEIVETRIEALKVSHPLFFFGAWVDISEIPGVDIDELMGITSELNTNKSYSGSVSNGKYTYSLNNSTNGNTLFKNFVSPYTGDAYLYNAADVNSINNKITGITYSKSGTQETIELTLAQEVATKNNDATPVHKGLYEDFSGTAGAPGMDDGRVTVGPTKMKLVINENGTLDYLKISTSFEMYSQMTEEGISFRMTVDGTKVEDTYTFTR